MRDSLNWTLQCCCIIINRIHLVQFKHKNDFLTAMVLATRLTKDIVDGKLVLLEFFLFLIWSVWAWKNIQYFLNTFSIYFCGQYECLSVSLSPYIYIYIYTHIYINAHYVILFIGMAYDFQMSYISCNSPFISFRFWFSFLLYIHSRNQNQHKDVT